MIKKEKLNNLTKFEQQQLVDNLRELYYAVNDYFHYGLNDDMENIEVFGRPVLNHLKNIIQ